MNKMNNLPTPVPPALDLSSHATPAASLHRLWPALPAATQRQLAQQVARLLVPMLTEPSGRSTTETAHAERAARR